MSLEAQPASKLVVDHVSMAFKTPKGVFQALAPVTLSIPQGRFVSLIGPSGCGKSTIFNIIAGLLEPSAGRVRIDGVDATGTIGRVGYMLQKDLLLPWRTRARQRHPRHGDPGRAAARGARTRAAAAATLRAVGLRASLSEFAVGRHAPARGALAYAPLRHRHDPARRAVRRPRCADQAAHAGVADAALERFRQNRAVRHARCRGGDLPVGRTPRHGHASGPRHRDDSGDTAHGRACAPAR